MYNIRQFKPVLYLLLMVGITGFSLAAASPGLWVVGATGVMLNAWLVFTGRFTPMPRMLANAVTLAATLYCARQMLTNSGPAVIVIGQFLVLLHLVKLWEQRANRDYAQLLILSLLLMVAAAINTASLVFGVLFVTYLFLSLYCCLLFHLKVDTDVARAALELPEQDGLSPQRLRQDQRYLSRSMRRLTAFVSVVAVLMAVAVFLFFPRGSGANLLGPLQFRPSQPLTGFSDEVGFQKIAQIQQNDQIMAYVKVWKNDEPVEGGTLLLRGTTLDRYTGRDDPRRARWQWVRSRPRWGPPHSSAPGEVREFVPDVADGDFWRQEIHLFPTGTATLFALPGVLSFTPTKRGVEFFYSPSDSVLQTAAALQHPFDYEVVSRGALDLPAFNRSPLPGTPSAIDPKVGEYARRAEVSGEDEQGALAARRPADYGRAHALDGRIAAAIEQHLRTQFSYTLDLTDARKIIEGQDPLVAFLYDLKRGHCEYFAGAMALMCQSLGMQARVVTGFKCDEFNDTPGAGYYIVRQAHAHAWVEVRTPEGWKTYDPTSGNDAGRAEISLWQRVKHLFNYMEFTYANSVIAFDNTNQENLINSVETRMTNSMYRGVGWAQQLKAFLESEQFDYLTSHLVFVMMGLIVLALVGFVGWFLLEKWALRRRAQRIGLESLPPAEQLRLARQLEWYDDLLQLLAEHRIMRPRHLTALEFSRSLTFLPAGPYETVRRLARMYNRVRFGHGELDAGQRRRLTTVIGRLQRELDSLRAGGAAAPAAATA
jgi:protein-glutamine gamma-glutamyltransferase